MPNINWTAIARWLRLTDDNGVLSLTNLTVIVALARIALVPQASAVDLGALLLAAAKYTTKKIIDQQADGAATPPDTTGPRIDELASNLTQLRDDLGKLQLSAAARR